MKRKTILVFFSSIVLLFPFSASAEEQDRVGIGFKAAQTEISETEESSDLVDLEIKEESVSSKKPLNSVMNVLPLTLGSKKNCSMGTNKRALPKTGEAIQLSLRMVGLLCISCSFWLFLFTRLKEEENNE